MKIFLAIPTINRLYPDMVKALFEINKNTEHEITLRFISSQPTDVVRNKLVEEFLETDCEVLWFMDDDAIPPVDILSLLEGPFDIIAPLTYIYQEHNLIPNLWMIDGKKKSVKKTDGKQLEKVDACGMGCVFIGRNVFEGMEKPYFKFVTNVNHNTLLESETFYFFKKVKKLDYNVYVDPRMNCGHIKHMNLDLVAYQMSKAVKNYKGRTE